jgi:hypothetical protein
MASILRIKRSGTSGNPSTLGQGELAYSSLADNGSNGGDRLYIGTGTETSGNAVNHEVIGGKYFTSKLDHTLGTLTPNSAILVDANSKIDVLNVDNITLNGNTISTTNSNGGLILAPNGTGTTTVNSVVFGTTVDVVGKRITQVATPTADSDAATKAYVDAVTAGQTFTIGDGSATDTFNAASGTLTFTGLTGITTAVTNDAVSFDLDDTSVTAGDYGSATAIPTFTVDGQGRLTAAGTASISTSLNVQGDTIPLASQSLLFASSGDGISFAYDSGTNTATYSMATATTSAKGVASFATADFGVSSGAVSLNDAVVKGVGANSGSTTPTGHSFSIIGDSSQGITTSGSGANVTVTIADATVSAKGVASFATADFGVSSGAVSLNDAVLKTITTDTGAGLTPSSHGISIVGGEGVDVTHAGSVITVLGEDATYTNKGIASFDTNDFTVTSGAVSIKSGSVANADLTNDGIVIGSTDVSLGGTITSLVGLTNVTVDDITLNGNVISTPSSVNDIILDPKGGDSAGGRVIIQGDLLVQGTETIVNSTTMTINDKNLVLADSAADATAANGAGITINGASATLQYLVSGDKWEVNKDFNTTGELYRNGTAIGEYIQDVMGTAIAVGEGLDFAYNDGAGTHTFSAELATITNKGVASYDSDQFTVTSGAVTVSTLDGGTY